MAARRLSRLQRHILNCLMADSGWTMLGHVDLAKTLGRDKSNISHSLRTLEARGLIVISRTTGGQANTVHLTPEGRNVTSQSE